MIRHILRKDWSVLWPMVVLVTLIQVCLEWVQYEYGFFGDVAGTGRLLRPLTDAWYAAIAALAVAVVQLDAIPATDQDWLIRPLPRTDLLLAKVLFVLVTVAVPMFVLDLGRAIATGFSPAASLAAIAVKESYVIVYLMIPVMAIAATTTRMTELIVFGGALVVAYALTQSVAAAIGGAGACPTCDSGLVWIQHTWQHIGVLVGAVVILSLQYYRRAVRLSRAIALLGVLALVFAQLPWSTAFALQRRLSPVPGAATAVTISIDPRLSRVDSGRDVPRGFGAATATRALLHGDLHKADKYMRGLAHAGGAPVRVELPLRIAGVAADELLFVDRADLTLSNDAGERLYTGADRDGLALVGISAAGPAAVAPIQSGLQAFDIPATAYRLVAPRAVRLQIRYSLTLMNIVARFAMGVQDEFHSADIGHCASRLGRDGTGIELSCRQVGAGPTCLSATLYDRGERHNPEVLRCEPDYRPYMPALTDALSFYGLEVPVRDPTGLAHYPIEPSAIEQSHLLIKLYEVREHVTRVVVIPHIRLADYPGG